MAKYYLDIETLGLDPKVDKIITIQYQELDRNSGKAIGPLVILKEWELTEREMLLKFIRDCKIGSVDKFDFIPVGYNLGFEHNFLKERTLRNDVRQLDILGMPFIDLHALGILMNNGEFKGSGLDKLTGKAMSGRLIPEWYGAKEYDKIRDYIVNETESFLEFHAWLCREMPSCLERFKNEHSANWKK